MDGEEDVCQEVEDEREKGERRRDLIEGDEGEMEAVEGGHEGHVLKAGRIREGDGRTEGRGKISFRG